METATPRDPTHDEHAEIPVEAQLAFAAALLILAVVLLVLVPFQTRPAPAGKGWYLQPHTWPIFSLLLVAIPAAIQTVALIRRARKARDRAVFRKRALWAFGDLRLTIEYSLYFLVYLYAIGYVGFALSTLVFGQVCLWRAGLRSLNWALANLGFTLVLVLGLRVGMDLWFPVAPLYEYFPDWFVETIGLYL